jgi:Putative auto-transporter adhesin, head GIN domain
MFRIALGLLCLLPLAGCGPVTVGSGRVVTETRPLGDVRTVNLSGTGDLTIQLGAENTIEIETDDNIVPLVETKESGDELTIRVKGNVSPSNGLNYRVTVRSLDAVSVSGSGTVTVNRWSGSAGKVAISGSGDVLVAESTLESLTLKLSGSGTLTAAGRADTLDLHLSGSGTCHADELRANDVKIAISGSGSVAVWAEKELSAKLSGSGSVTYLGNPSVHSKVSGSGSVRPAK